MRGASFIWFVSCMVPASMALAQSLPPGVTEQAGRQQQEQILREQQRQQQQQIQPPVDVRLDDPRIATMLLEKQHAFKK